ncbi:MAG: phytoene/squalene synthase family protein [Flavobacteriaceae bacterium]|nr:phytoene/squalene synthase family protein [Flavobacteriaceae bacterium]MBL6678195.1 phytoene/squalene synthase family protein [Flavobacteriaceae bacterium]
MKSIFDKVSEDSSKIVIKRYSTSFYFSSSLLSKSIRQDIFNIYGFVRLADEIVDTFHDFPKKKLLNEFEEELWRSIENKISLNPILNSFQNTVNRYSIPKDLIRSFLDSMKMDLEKKEYNSVEEYKKYIYGSADVVGLMCLKVFVKGSEALYSDLSDYAISLGSAFQKVNFLRDLKDDSNILKRVYFPNVNMDDFNEESKKEIINEIELDFKNAIKGIARLPKNSRFAVYIAYRYYNKLLKKLKRTSSENIVKKRVRIHNFQKFTVIARSYVKYQLNLIQWI